MRNYLSKYVGIILFLATLMGSFHHHDDGRQHEDCQVCTLQSTMLDSDVPQTSTFLTYLENFSEAIVTPLFSVYKVEYISNVNSRAPPQFS
ncbi:hypothetical protein [Sulfurimonas sp.]|uniref:hypothetical protein n=1 Tax=Sulfurimonas sp. TaxID=2022749 RepID=UPI003D0F9D67